MKKMVWLMAVGAVLMLGGVCGWQYYNYRIQKSSMEVNENANIYAKHYMMIADQNDTELWNKIYQSAKEEAAKEDAYLELVGNDALDEYSMEDYMNIAIAEKVDGIILRPEATTQMKSLINDAVTAGIPVVTVIEDDAKSTRTSFVGVNSYQMGEKYGEEILNCLTEDTKKIMVIMNDDSDNSNDNLVFSRIRSTIMGGLEDKDSVSVDAAYIQAYNEFDSEEAIRDIFSNAANPPDMVVCLNEIDTECAYQTVLDYNQADQTQIIGFYQSKTILEGVEKNIIPVSIALDTTQMGTYCVQALGEYLQDGITNEYFSVDLNLITKENVTEYQGDYEDETEE